MGDAVVVGRVGSAVERSVGVLCTAISCGVGVLIGGAAWRMAGDGVVRCAWQAESSQALQMASASQREIDDDLFIAGLFLINLNKSLPAGRLPPVRINRFSWKQHYSLLLPVSLPELVSLGGLPALPDSFASEDLLSSPDLDEEARPAPEGERWSVA